MQPRNLTLVIVIAAFGLLTGHAMLEVGYVGIWRAGLANWGAAQVLCDLVIVCSLASLWIYADARARGINPWPWLLLTLVAGSFGPLLYLLRRTRTPAARLVTA